MINYEIKSRDGRLLSVVAAADAVSALKIATGRVFTRLNKDYESSLDVARYMQVYDDVSVTASLRDARHD